MTLIVSNTDPDSQEEPCFIQIFPKIEDECEALLEKLDTDNDLTQLKKTADILYLICPNSHSVLYLQGYACMLEDKLEDAVFYFRKAIDIFPYFSAALCNLGVVYSQLNQINQSVYCLRKVFDIEEPESEIYQSAQEYLKDFEAHFQRLFSLTVDEYLPVEWLYTRARECMKEEKYEDAVVFFQQVVAKAPRYIQAHNNMGASYTGLGEYPLALECCEKTLAIDPQNALALYNRQFILERLKAGITERAKLKDFPDIVKERKTLSL